MPVDQGGSAGGPARPPLQNYYRLEDYLVPQADAVRALGHRYEALAQVAMEGSSGLTGARTPRWTGHTGSAYAAWLEDLRTRLAAPGPALTAAATACRTAETGYADAYEAGAAAVRDLEQTRATFDYADQIPDNPKYVQAMQPPLNALWKAMQADFLTSARLAAALDGPADTIVSITLPVTPSYADAHAAGENELKFYDSVFDPVDAARDDAGDYASRDLLAKLNRWLDDGWTYDAKELLVGYAHTSGESLDWIVTHLDDDRRRALFAALDPAADREIYNALAAKLPADTMARLTAADPQGYWKPVADATGGFDAALRAAEARDPRLLDDRVRQNDNGSFTVTFVKDGEPLEVVVPAGAVVTNPNAPYLERPAVYAQAYQQVRAELGTDPLTAITGRPSHIGPAKGVDFADLQDAMNDGRPVFVTMAGDTGDVRLRPGQIVGVDGVYPPDPDATHDGGLQIGPMTMTQNEFWQRVGTVTIGGK